MLKDALTPISEGLAQKDVLDQILYPAAQQLLELDKLSKENPQIFMPYIDDEYQKSIAKGYVTIDYPGIPFTCLGTPYEHNNWQTGRKLCDYPDNGVFILLRVIRQGRFYNDPFFGRTLDLYLKTKDIESGSKSEDHLCKLLSAATVFLPKDFFGEPVVLTEKDKEDLNIETLYYLCNRYSGTMWSPYLTNLPTV